MEFSEIDRIIAVERGNALLDGEFSKSYVASNVADYIRYELGGSDEDVEQVLNDLGLTLP